jgi:hypothetical protein
LGRGSIGRPLNDCQLDSLIDSNRS